PLGPLLQRPPRADIALHNPVQQHRRAHVDARQPRHLDGELEVDRHGIARVQRPVLRRRVRDGQQAEHVVLVDAGRRARQLREAAVGRVARLADDADVKVVLLRREEGGAEVEEARRRQAQHGEGRLVRQRRRRVPRLHLVPEDDLQAARPGRVLPHGRRHRPEERLVELGREGADVVEVDLERVRLLEGQACGAAVAAGRGGWRRGRGEGGWMTAADFGRGRVKRMDGLPTSSGSNRQALYTGRRAAGGRRHMASLSLPAAMNNDDWTAALRGSLLHLARRRNRTPLGATVDAGSIGLPPDG
ncbi:hypothetical protein BN1723_014419, partial [Verticillium longisporum]